MYVHQRLAPCVVTDLLTPGRLVQSGVAVSERGPDTLPLFPPELE